MERREIRGLLFDVGGHGLDLVGKLRRRQLPEPLVLDDLRRGIDAALGLVERLDDGSHPHQQFIELVVDLQLVVLDLHAIQRDLAGGDSLGQVLDMNLALLVKRTHDVEEQALGAYDLDLCHRDKHCDHPPWGPYSPS